MKEFEKEYRQMIQEEMPDLWGRIEAGLKDRAADGAIHRSEKVKEWERVYGQNPGSRQEQADGQWKITAGPEIFTGKQRKIVPVKRQRYMGVVAACLCGVIAVPAVIVLLRAGAFGAKGSDGSTSSTAMDTETADMAAGECSEAVAAEAEENATDMAGNEESAMDTAGNPEAAAPVGAAENMESTSEAGGMENGDGKEASGMQADDTAAAAENSAADGSDMPDQTMIENVRVKILEVSDMQYHTVYLAVVEQDDSGWMQEGKELYFLSGKEEALEEGAEYQVSLLYLEGAEIPFRLSEYGGIDDF